MKVRPHIGASLAAGFANKPRLEIGEPDVIGQMVRNGRDRVAALKILAIRYRRKSNREGAGQRIVFEAQRELSFDNSEAKDGPARAWQSRVRCPSGAGA